MRMSWEDGLNSATIQSSDAHLKWLAKKSAQVFKAFRAAFQGAGSDRLVCVIAAQAGGGAVLLQQLKVCHTVWHKIP